MWANVLPGLPAAWRAYAPDIRGFGQSDKPASGYTYEVLVEDLAAFLDALSLPKAVFVGHSFGGCILQHFAVRYPDRLSALILSNTYACNLPPRGITAGVQARLDGYGTEAQNREIFNRTVPRYFDPANIAPQDIERFVAMARQAGNPALKQTLITMYASPAIPSQGLAAIQAPTLIIVGAHDPYGTFDQAVALSDCIPNSRIAVVPRCGHSPMWEKPQEYVGILTDFLCL
jgi:pimeloyl-ACP methyl ester carboxylesterase